MSSYNYYELLSDSSRVEFARLIKNKENAYDLILKNYLNSEKSLYSYSDISSRLQIQYFALAPNILNVQTRGIQGWLQNETGQPNEVADGIIPLIELTNDRGRIMQYYSSFATKEVENKFGLRYPLVDDHTNPVSSFDGASMPGNIFNQVINLFKDRFNIQIEVGDDTSKKSLFHKYGLSVSPKCISGTIYLDSKTPNGYKYSNVEKLVRVYYEVASAVAERNINSFKIQTKQKFSKDMQFASVLFATLLLSRVSEYENPEINAIVERCLWLQYANVINRAEMSPAQLNVVTELGATTAAEMVEKLGLSVDAIKEIMEQNDYSYAIEPTNIKEALLYATEASYVKYAKPMYDNIVEFYQNQSGKSGPYKTRMDNEVNEILELAGPESTAELSSDIAGLLNSGVAQIEAGSRIQLLPDGDGSDSMRSLTDRSFLTSQSTSQNIEEKVIGFNKNSVRANTVDKILDEMITKAISDRAISIARHIGARDYSEFGGRENCEKVCSLLANV